MEEFTLKALIYRITRAIWFLFGIIESFLFLRFLLRLFGANPNARFTMFIYSLTNPLMAPFSNVFNVFEAGGVIIDANIILALFVYYLVAWGIIRLILMARPIHMIEKEGKFKK